MKRTLIFLALFLLLALPAPVLAQQQNPPVDPNSMWGEVVDQNGNIRYNNLTDLGTVQQSANWMPSIPGIGSLQASYHEYQTPSGNIVVLPTASTLFFMALNPQASGLAQADSQLGLGAGMVLEAPGIIKGMLQGYIDPAAITRLGYTNPDDFFSDVVNGKQNIWSVGGMRHDTDFFTILQNSLSQIRVCTPCSCSTPQVTAPRFPAAAQRMPTCHRPSVAAFLQHAHRHERRDHRHRPQAGPTQSARGRPGSRETRRGRDLGSARGSDLLHIRRQGAGHGKCVCRRERHIELHDFQQPGRHAPTGRCPLQLRAAYQALP